MKRLPLEGVRIADLTMMWAGPYATRVLAEMGAEIVKIESPRAWDNVRTLLPVEHPEPWNASVYFNDYARDKKSLTLDLAQPRGRELFLQFVAKCDVVIENYRAEVLDKLGVGYEVLRAARPDVHLPHGAQAHAEVAAARRPTPSVALWRAARRVVQRPSFHHNRSGTCRSTCPRPGTAPAASGTCSAPRRGTKRNSWAK